MSGTLPASPILQQFQSNGSPSLASFFASTNNNPFSIGCLSDSSPKNKRSRQRVDAGEPRNNYQGALMNQLRLGPDSRHTDRGNENTEQDEEDYESVEQPMQDGDLLENPASDFELSDEDIEGDQRQESNDNPVDLCASNQPPSLSAELPTLIKSDPTENRNTNNSAMSSSSSKRKRFQPQRQPIKVDHSIESNDEAAFDEKQEKDEPKPKLDFMEKQDTKDEMNPLLQKELANRSQQSALPPPLNANLNGSSSSYQSNMFANKMFMEMQRRMYASAMGQQQNQQNGRNEEENSVNVRNAVMKDIIRFVQTLNEKFLSMSNDFPLIETEKALKQQKEKQQQDWRGPQPFMPPVGAPPNMNTMNPLFNPLNLPYANPRQLLAMAASQSPLHSIANSMQNSTNSTPNSNMSFANLVNNPSSNSNNKLSNSGIFPSAIPNFAPFNGFVNHAAANNLAKVDDGSPRKKRSKVTDSVRGPRSAVRDNGQHSLPASSRSSPQPNGYFAPTMVPHPLYNNTSFQVERTSQSPGNSDFSDYGNDGSFSQSSTLTPAHLRKAKLMFFYTRYPSSSVLKSYFPDINFNKSNTAQLVKWFSNFRE